MKYHQTYKQLKRERQKQEFISGLKETGIIVVEFILCLLIGAVLMGIAVI